MIKNIDFPDAAVIYIVGGKRDIPIENTRRLT